MVLKKFKIALTDGKILTLLLLQSQIWNDGRTTVDEDCNVLLQKNKKYCKKL